jgi:curved DNA-binding protein CbpA
MGMNQKTALKILGLGPGASLAQAKKAFRDLAKQYHPDRHSKEVCPGDEIGAAQVEVRMGRMKQINQAFHFLLPLLAPADEPVEKVSATPSSPKKKVQKEKAQGKTDIGFLNFFRFFKQKLNRHPKSDGQKQTFAKQPPSMRGGRKKRPLEKEGFATILHTLHPGAVPQKRIQKIGRGSSDHSQNSKGTFPGARAHPYGNFLKYMDLKKKIDARARCGEQNVNKIEPIQPVTRVNPIGSKDKS